MSVTACPSVVGIEVWQELFQRGTNYFIYKSLFIVGLLDPPYQKSIFWLIWSGVLAVKLLLWVARLRFENVSRLLIYELFTVW